MFARQPEIEECSKSEVDLFTTPETQTCIENNFYTRVNPITAISSPTAPIEFCINSSSDHFIDPTNIFLYCRFAIKKENGTPLPDDYKCYPETNTLHSMFSDCEVFIQDQKITTGAANYSYRSYIENMLSYSANDKQSKLVCEGFYSENKRNEIKTHYSKLKSKVFEGMGRLHIDICHQPRLILSGCDVKIKLFRNNAEFVIKKDTSITDNDKLIPYIEEIFLHVRRVKLTPHQQIYIEKNLNNTSAKYPISRVEVKTFTISAGLSSLMLSNVVNGKLPNRIIYGLVEHNAYIGIHNKPGFIFNHHNVKSTAVYVNGTLFTHPIESSFSDNDTQKSLNVRAYHSLFNELSEASDMVDLTINEFKDHCCLYAVDLTQDRCVSLNEHLNPSQQGELSLNFEFANAVTQTLTLVVYLEFSGLIQLDKARQIYTDF